MERNPLYSIRKDYLIGQLSEENMNPNPIIVFSEWLNHAMEKVVIEPTAMALATVDQSGCPLARMVLLKSFSEKGFVFFTNTVDLPFSPPKVQSNNKKLEVFFVTFLFQNSYI